MKAKLTYVQHPPNSFIYNESTYESKVFTQIKTEPLNPFKERKGESIYDRIKR